MKKALLTGILTAFLAMSASGYDVSVGRLSYIEEDVWILKDMAVNWTDAMPNMVIERDDIIETGRKSRAEIELCMGAVLWMNSYTRAEILDLEPDKASVYISYSVVRAKNVRDNKLVIRTDGSTVSLDVESEVRIEVFNDGRVEVYVLDGWATVETSEEIKTVWEGERVCVTYSGRITGRYACKPDGFDSFCDCRCEKYTRQYFDVGVFLGCCDLDAYGTWVFIQPYGHVWRPRVVRGWRPFLCGYWFWDVSFGWIWISFEPWGFLPYHYGHWIWYPGYGWVWCPGRIWSPGWVVWFYDGPYIGWAPAGPDGAPPNTDDCWTFISQESFYNHPPARQIDYKESIKNHPIYEIEYEIPKHKLKEVNFSSAPGPKLRQISESISLADEYSSPFDKPIYKEKVYSGNDEAKKVTPEAMHEVSEKGISPTEKHVLTPIRNENDASSRSEERSLRSDENSYDESQIDRKAIDAPQRYNYKSSSVREDAREPLYTRKETDKTDRSGGQEGKSIIRTREIKKLPSSHDVQDVRRPFSSQKKSNR